MRSILEMRAMWLHRVGFGRGLKVTVHVAGAVLFATAIGYGASARDAGLSIGQTMTMVALFNALPAQVVFVDQIGRGAGILAAGFLVALTAVRFLPTTASVMPYLKADNTRWCHRYGAVHFMSFTTWVEANQRLPALAPEARLPHFVGIGLGVLLFTMAGTALGFYTSAVVPPLATAALLFMMPIYFVLSLLGPVKSADDFAAIGLGAILGPLLFVYFPGFDLLLTGLIGGTGAYLIGRSLG